MHVDVVLYKDETAIATYGADGANWRDCADAINYWYRIEVAPYWPAGTLRIAACAGTDPFAAAAIYGIGQAWGIIENLPHDWLPPYPVQVDNE
jgi:hypothetical protein